MGTKLAAKQTKYFAVLGLLGALLFTYQNCAPASFSGRDPASSKVTQEAALTCVAFFNPSAVTVSGNPGNLTAPTVLNISTNKDVTGTYSCTANGVPTAVTPITSGNTVFQNATISQNVGYPTQCMVNVVTAKGETARCQDSFSTDPKVDVACPVSPATQNLYNSTKETLTTTQDAIAMACIDSYGDYNTNINWGPSNTFAATRFSNTCASRWCRAHYGAPLAVGALKSAIQYNSSQTQLDVTASASVECRVNVSNAISQLNNVCIQTINSNPPLTFNSLAPNGPNCAQGCGCDINAWYNNFVGGNAITCGTAYCKTLDSTYKWGVLSELVTAGSGYYCSRADF